MYSAEDLFTEQDVNNDLIQVEDDIQNSGNELQENENALNKQQEGNEAGEEPNNDDQEKTVVKPRRTVRNPQPKLNVRTLQGPKGLLCLEEHFKNKKFKGRGHEQEDLKTVMKTYEYWCHRLFPKYPFDDCLAKIESLGTKKPLQTYLKRIRMGLIFDEEKPIQSDKEENQAIEDQAIDNQFNELVSQGTTQSPEDEDHQITEEQLELVPQGTAQILEDDQQITEEQLERIRLNKERADCLRREKLEKCKQTLQGADCNGEVEETEEQLERIRVNKEKAERLRQERSRRDKPCTSDFIIEENSTKTQEIDLESQSDNTERQFLQDNELQIDITRISDSAKEGNVACEVDDIQNGEESVDRLAEHENNDLTRQNTCESLQAQISKDQESPKSVSIQSDKDNEESMDCS